MGNKRVSLIPLKHSRGFALMVDKNEPGNSMVFICDISGDCLFRKKLQNGLINETKFLTTQLAEGQYSVEVYSKDLDVKSFTSTTTERGELKTLIKSRRKVLNRNRHSMVFFVLKSFVPNLSANWLIFLRNPHRFSLFHRRTKRLAL